MQAMSAGRTAEEGDHGPGNDHVAFLLNQCSDDVAHFGVSLPKVLSPKKGGYVQEEETYEDESDSDFADSDYDFEDDDGLFAKYVDEEVVDDHVVQRRPVQCYPRGEDDILEEIGLHGTNVKGYNYSYHNPKTDRDNPKFKVGMVFPTAKDVRRAISMYAMTTRYQVRKIRNNSIRVEAQCEQKDCPWKLIATKDSSHEEAFVVKTYVAKHTCEKVWQVKELTGPLLIEKFVDEFRVNENMGLKGFANKVQQKYNMVPDRFKLARARLSALKKIRGDEIAQWNHLWDFRQEVRTTNPGSSYYLKCIDNAFSTLYL
ncbi:hypothetical protein ACQ4PT_034316 [Festuca glaucescens]